MNLFSQSGIAENTESAYKFLKFPSSEMYL